jgi:sRNA-binding regulator protein Hfq
LIRFDRRFSKKGEECRRLFRQEKKDIQMPNAFRGFILLLIVAMAASASTTTAESPPQIPLPKLVTDRFGKLSLAEERLVNAATTGETADCTNLSGDDQKIRGDLLSWLCTNPQAAAQLTFRGVSVVGAEIDRQVNLGLAKISFPIAAHQCVFKDAIDLAQSRIAILDLAGSSVTDLWANSTFFEESVFLRNGFRAEGGVDLVRAKIGGNLDCEGGQFIGKGTVLALNANSVEVKGGVLLGDGFRAEGEVDLSRAKIANDLDCVGGQFISKVDETAALDAVGTEVKGHVLLCDGFRAEGCVILINATIEGGLDCIGGQFVSKGETAALDAKAVEVKGAVLLRNGFKADGGVNLINATIVRGLDCEGGQFIGKDTALGLDANGVEVKGAVLLRNGFRAEKGVNLVSAKIGGTLECEGGQFIGKGTVLALNANSIEVRGDVFLTNGFKAEGGVDLRGAKIEANLSCDGGQFIGNDKALALTANNATVKRFVFLTNGFKAEGGVNLIAARIDGDLFCGGGQFIGNDKTPALDASEAKIGGVAIFNAGFAAEGNVDFVAAHANLGLVWSDVKSPEKVSLDVRLSKVGTLFNSRNSWPNQGLLRVDGFVYDQISDLAPPNAEVQLGWLGRQSRDRFRSQPFEQLAGVLRKMGLEEDARAVMIAKNEEHARYVQWRPEWLWYGLFGHLIGYGYSPWRAFFISLAVIGIGWWLFRRGYRRGLVTPSGDVEYTITPWGAEPTSKDHPKFNPGIYSVEAFVPLIKLGLGDYWAPNANRGRVLNFKVANLRISAATGSLLRYYLWLHIILGWVLTTLWVGGITGLVKT